MKIRFERRMTVPTRTHSFIRWSRRLFFAIGVLALSYVAFTLLDARLFQAAQSRQFQEEMNRVKPSSPLRDVLREASVRADSLGTAGRGESTLGRIEISTIGLSAMILEGTEARTLRRAVGHVPGTPLPGQQGNVVVTGHRDTFFRPLHNIRKNDEITLTTLSGSYLYRVDSTEVVEPEDTQVLAGSDDAALTLVTCYPFYFVGPAPKRFVVHAHLIPG